MIIILILFENKVYQIARANFVALTNAKCVEKNSKQRKKNLMANKTISLNFIHF